MLGGKYNAVLLLSSSLFSAIKQKQHTLHFYSFLNMKEVTKKTKEISTIFKYETKTRSVEVEWDGEYVKKIGGNKYYKSVLVDGEKVSREKVQRFFSIKFVCQIFSLTNDVL